MEEFLAKREENHLTPTPLLIRSLCSQERGYRIPLLSLKERSGEVVLEDTNDSLSLCDIPFMKEIYGRGE